MVPLKNTTFSTKHKPSYSNVDEKIKKVMFLEGRGDGYEKIKWADP